MIEKKPYGMEKSDIQPIASFELLKKNSYRKYSPLTDSGVGELWIISTHNDFVCVEMFSGVDSEYEAFWVRMKASMSRNYFVINFRSHSAYLNLKPYKFGNLSDMYRNNRLADWNDLFDDLGVSAEVPMEIKSGVRQIITTCYPDLAIQFNNNEYQYSTASVFDKTHKGKIVMPACLYYVQKKSYPR